MFKKLQFVDSLFYLAYFTVTYKPMSKYPYQDKER